MNRTHHTIALLPLLLIAAVCSTILIGTSSAQSPPPAVSDSPSIVRPPQGVSAIDTEGDEGRSITVTWELSPDDHGDADLEVTVIGYEILRAESTSGPFSSVGFAPKGATRFADASTHDGVDYYFQVVTSAATGGAAGPVVGPVQSSEQWFNTNRTNVLLIGLLISGAIIYFIASAKRGKKLFIRRIAGLEAVQEAIGRATEMGRPILYIPGIQDMDDVQTVAGVTILGYVARTIAEYDTKIEVPTSRSIVMSTARETIKAAYMAAGRPEAYSDDSVHYVTDEQFGYVAAVDGIMVRDKPATCFYMGAFFAESLIMAETGNSIGAIQIAGTAMPAQLPFFVAACDYTLIGEELFAASAYLSNEPRQLGSLKGQDVGKTVAMLAIASGVLLLTLYEVTRVEWFMNAGNWFKDLFLVN